MGKKTINYFFLLVGLIISHVFVLLALTEYGTQLNQYIFERKQIISQKDKIWVAKTMGLYLSLFLFGVAVTIMLLRIVGGKATPASNNDPNHINLLNRILTNTIEQAIIFAGLYGPILFGASDGVEEIGGVRVLTLASVFVVGRVVFAVGYVLGTVVGIPTLRSTGFAINVVLNILMIAYHLRLDLFKEIDSRAAPLIKTVLHG